MIDRVRSFWQELIRRRVARAGAAYGAVSFITLQLGEILLPAFGLGPGGLRTLFAALLAGFPVVLAASWVYDISVSGLRRTPDARTDPDGGPVAIQPPSNRLIAMVIGAAAGLGAVGWWIVGGGAETGTVPVSVPSMFVSAAVLLVVGWWSIHESDRGPETASSQTRPSIAVLPFVNWGPPGSERFLGDALADDIRDLFGSVDGLHVAARTSCFSSSQPPTDARLVGRKLGVSHLLEGSVLRNDEHMRVTAQLIDTQTGFLIWSRTYQCALDGSLTCHSGIARSIVDGLLHAPESRDRLQPGSRRGSRSSDRS